MKSRGIGQIGLGLAVVVGGSSTASAFEVAVTAAIERSSASSRVEVFASLVLPLDEWVQVTPQVVRRLNDEAVYASAWENAESGEELAAARDGAALSWLIEPPWVEPRLFDPGQTDVAQTPASEVAAEDAAGPDAPRPARVGTSSSIGGPKPPKLDQRFVKALMAACSGEFRDVRGELENLADRARLSAWLPELQVKGGRNTDQTLRLSPTEAEPDRYQVVGGDGVRFEGQIRWTFSQLIFARDELAVARLRGALDVEKRKRQQQAMDALAKWLRAWMVLGSRSAEAGDLLTAWVSENALRAELDWLSQGWFSAHVPAAPEWADLRAE